MVDISVWHPGTDIQAPTEQSNPNVGTLRLGHRERLLIELLMEGCTDAAIARRMCLSERTVRRITARLMASLGARSRFEAGVRAAQAGWCTGSPSKGIRRERR
ncbi:response regulator transcription factor [Nocardia halotolerans]|uniref:Response regulator transcription factor n=1 Tax=Nocardia halotolerans TaxID=1755878 RepID=A0ABV8VEL2_9NOCA